MSRRSTQRPVSLIGGAQALLLFSLFVLLAGAIIGELTRGVLIGSMAFLVWRFGVVRQLLCYQLRDGMTLARAARHEEALKAFARSAQAWEERKRVDDLRGILLGSASRWPFRHLSRYNEAWCMARLGHDNEARVALDALLREQPGMRVAQELRASLDPAPQQAPDVGADGSASGGEPTAEEDWRDLLQDEPTLDPRGAPEG